MKFTIKRSGVPAKREPVTAPNATITVLVTHHGITTWIVPLPCNAAEVSMAPNSKPPGKRMACAISEPAVATAMRIASSPNCAGSKAPAGPRVAWPARPNSASPAGKPTAMIVTRKVCTMAMARMSAPSSAASAITCDKPPGAEAR